MKPASAPIWLGLGSGLIVAALLVHLFAPASGPDVAENAPAMTPDGTDEMAGVTPGSTEREPDGAADREPDGAAGADTERDGDDNPSASEPPDAAGRPADPPAPPERPEPPHAVELGDGIVEVTVPDGATATTVAELLAEAGVLVDEDGFLQLVAERQVSTRLRAGRHRLRAGDSFEAILEQLLHPGASGAGR